MVTEQELQSILESDAPLEIETQADGSITAVPLGTACNQQVEKLTLEKALAQAEAQISAGNEVLSPAET